MNYSVAYVYLELQTTAITGIQRTKTTGVGAPLNVDYTGVGKKLKNIHRCIFVLLPKNVPDTRVREPVNSK